MRHFLKSNLRVGGLNQNPSRRRGAILILGTFLLLALMGFAAFAIDLGFISLTQAQLQNAADAAALAGVLELKSANGTPAQIKALAIAEAKKAASLNFAAGRSVDLRDDEIKFGNRHFNSGTGSWVTLLEGDPQFGTLPFNAITVNIRFGETSGTRRELELYFARIIDHDTCVVSGGSKANLTPRDLVFAIDISNSMNDDSDRVEVVRKLLDIPSATIPGAVRFNSDGSTTTPYRPKLKPANVSVTSSNGSSSGGVITINATNHGLVTGDTVFARASSSGASVTAAVTVVNANRFTLPGTLTFTSSGFYYPKGVGKNAVSGNLIRVRTNGTVGHGLKTGARVTTASLGGLSASANGNFLINVIDAFRFELVSSSGVTGTYTDDTGGWSLIPDNDRTNDNDYKALWLRCLDTNGTEAGGVNLFIDQATAEAFAAQEFPSGVTDPIIPAVDHPTTAYAYPNGAPWKHWKWKAFCDYAFFSGNNAYARNKNCVAGNGTPGFCLDLYTRFCIDNGVLPALRGQQFHPRDTDQDNDLADEVFPPANSAGENYSDYPNYAGFFNKPKYLAGYSTAGMSFSGANAGVHPLDIPDKPFCFVRQATILGLNAMIGDENAGNDAFDQVGLLVFGTRCSVEANLSNDVQETLKKANNRCCVVGSNMGITPLGNGNTNIGGAIRTSIALLTPGSGSSARSFTNKTIALLTDGVGNVVPAGGMEGPEYSNGVDTVVGNNSSAVTYAQYWAQKAADAKIVIHTITVGTGANPTLMQEIADTTGGQYFRVDNPAAQQAQLNNIFIAIGKDKLGKLFSQ